MATSSEPIRPADQELISELTQAVLSRAAPEELVVFDETAEEYFADPEATLRPRGRDEPVGFGLDIALLTPYVLAVATPVIQLMVGLVSDAVHTDSRSVLAPLVRRLLRIPGTAVPAAPEGPATGTSSDTAPLCLTTHQARRIRDVALERGRSLGLPDDRAAMLADAVVGGLVVGG
jgi:hypothetical protein